MKLMLHGVVLLTWYGRFTARCYDARMLTCAQRLVALVLLSGAAQAGPWLEPGDSGLRHDIQVLADAGVIQAAVTTWPLSWGDIAASINVAETALSDAENAALLRLQTRINAATEVGRLSYELHAEIAENPRQIRMFEDGPREDARLALAASWTGNTFAGRLEAGWSADPLDDREFRLDGSYLGAAVGNWMLSVSALGPMVGPPAGTAA